MSSDIVNQIINTALAVTIGILIKSTFAFPKKQKQKYQDLVDMVGNLANSINNLALQVAKHEEKIEESQEERMVTMQALFDITDGFKKMNGNVSDAAKKCFDEAQENLQNHLNKQAH